MKKQYYEWFVPICGYEGLYEVSNLGRIKSLGNDKSRKEKILKPVENSSGYLKIMLYKDGKPKPMKVHRLVATAFIQRPNLFCTEVNHINEDKTNNAAFNLEWCTREYNNNYGTHNQRAAEAQSMAVIGISIEDGHIIEFPSTKEAGRQGFDSGAVCKCCNGKLNKHKGYYWKYKEAA